MTTHFVTERMKTRDQSRRDLSDIVTTSSFESDEAE